MYNTDLPSRAELPTSAQLVRSTVLAAAAAAALLVTVVLPAEYAVDPTGVGRFLGLTQKGEIKTQLAAEAAADAAKPADPAPQPAASIDSAAVAKTLQSIELRLAAIEQGMANGAIATRSITPAAPAKAAPVAETEPETKQEAASRAEDSPSTDLRRDQLQIVLEPGQGAEVKAVVKQGDTFSYAWSVEGGVVNYDLHGRSDAAAGKEEVSIRKDRGVPSDEGVLTAEFNGRLGWFWRNRGTSPVTVSLTLEGAHRDLVRVQ